MEAQDLQTDSIFCSDLLETDCVFVAAVSVKIM